MKTIREQPETIENRWDILYRDYPEVYEAFASVPYKPAIIAVIGRMFPLTGRTVLDIGSGTGRSAVGLARFAKSVVGVEPEAAMLQIALDNLLKSPLPNISYVRGFGQALPVKNQAVDYVLAVTCFPVYDADRTKMLEKTGQFVRESCRVIKPGGYFISIDVAPFWYGGDLSGVILGRGRVTKEDVEGKLHDVLAGELGFDYRDCFNVQDYGTVGNAVQTYGFIFGKKAIEYLKAHNKTIIKWKWRIHYKKV